MTPDQSHTNQTNTRQLARRRRQASHGASRNVEHGKNRKSAPGCTGTATESSDAGRGAAWMSRQPMRQSAHGSGRRRKNGRLQLRQFEPEIRRTQRFARRRQQAVRTGLGVRIRLVRRALNKYLSPLRSAAGADFQPTQLPAGQRLAGRRPQSCQQQRTNEQPGNETLRAKQRAHGLKRPETGNTRAFNTKKASCRKYHFVGQIHPLPYAKTPAPPREAGV